MVYRLRNKAVTWSFDDNGTDTGWATINELTGLVTAKGDGTVTVKATSVSAPSVSGTKKITISRQDEEAAKVTIHEIPGVTLPVKGATPVTTIGETDQYTGTVTWLPVVEDNKFAADTAYTARIELTAKAGYTLTTVGENFFTVAGATATNHAYSSIVTAVFPATEAVSEITGILFTPTEGLKEGNTNVAVGKVVITFSDEEVMGGTPPYTYSLVAGKGDTDNGKFGFDGTNLKIKDNPLTAGTYSVRVQIKDSRGKTLAAPFTITVAASATAEQG